MQLIKLYANRESFREVKFKPTGLNFIVAKQKNPGEADNEKTYNGVGKSLLVRIINFCLGADKDNYTSFCEKLEGWEFYLDFIIGTQNFTVKRSTNEPQKILLNGEEWTIKKYTNILQELCFSIPNDIKYISFRSLLPFFIRPSKESYADCMHTADTHTDYQKLLSNAFLIGLDTKLAGKKHDLKVEQERIKELEKNFKKDSLLRDFFIGNKDVSLELTEIDSRIEKMENDLSRFQVAENYYGIKQEADAINTKLFSLDNEIFIIENNIRNIEEILHIKPTSTISTADIEKIYKEAKVFFPESVKKTLHDIEIFYDNLKTSRVRRLSEQKNGFATVLKSKNSERIALQQNFDKKMKFLGEHRALDAFLALSQECSELKEKRNNLSKYQGLQSEYKSKEHQIKKEFLELLEITDKHLLEIEESVISLKEYFRDLAKSFYPKSTAGITINSRSGENQLAFDIEPRIELDASDGIGNVKIFCYDLSILFKGKNHKINFIFHDSRLFDSIDERQKAVMFRTIKENFLNSNKQYIAAINQNQLNEIKANMSSEDYDNIFQDDNIVLTLTDDNDIEKLLGIKVDIGQH
jgi:uncharacterized protein YydD (DUF2326 family)